MACDCIPKMDAELEGHGVCLDQASIRTWNRENETGVLTQRVRLHTVWLSERGRRKMGAIATYCPFCGEAYLPAKATGGA